MKIHVHTEIGNPVVVVLKTVHAWIGDPVGFEEIGHFEIDNFLAADIPEKADHPEIGNPVVAVGLVKVGNFVIEHLVLDVGPIEIDHSEI